MKFLLKYFAVTLFLLTAGKRLPAQDTALQESIRKILAGKEPDTVKIKELIDNAYPLAISGNPDALYVAAKAYQLLGDNFTKPWLSKRSMINNICGIYFMYTGKYDSAMYYYTRSLELGKKYNDDLIMAKAYNNFGSVYNYKADFEQAAANNFKALELFEKMNDTIGIAGALGNLGNNFIRLKQFDKAEGLLKQGISRTENKPDKRLLANLYNSLATVYGEKNNDSLELKYQLKAFLIYTDIKNTKGITTAAVNLSSIYSNRHQYDSSEKYALIGVYYAREIDDIQNLGELYYNQGANFAQKKKFTEALIAEDSAIYFCLQSGDRLVLSKAYEKKAEILSGQKDYEGGYEWLRKYTALNDSIYNDNIQTSVAEMQAKYENATKDKLLQQQKFELAKKTWWLAALSGLIIFGILLIYSFYRRNVLKQAGKLQAEIMKQQELATRAVMEAEENERRRIAGDLHDGVGQMMSAAKMNLSGFEDRLNLTKEEDRVAFNKIIGLVDESCREVRNVSHNMMPNALLKSGLSNAVKDFIDKIDSDILKINLYSEGLQDRFNANTETILYRIIQECVNNVIKHSGASELDISLIKDEEGIAATIEDNGRGFDLKGMENKGGMGLKNIRTRIAYLKGTLDFDSAPGKGTLVAIHVPV